MLSKIIRPADLNIALVTVDFKDLPDDVKVISLIEEKILENKIKNIKYLIHAGDLNLLTDIRLLKHEIYRDVDYEELREDLEKLRTKIEEIRESLVEYKKDNKKKFNCLISQLWAGGNAAY